VSIQHIPPFPQPSALTSTPRALWLSKSGYTSITIFDQQPYLSNAYSEGADGASADINKIIRFSYGTEIEYQRLAHEASLIWAEWNAELQKLKTDEEDGKGGKGGNREGAELPTGLKPGDKLWFNSGMLRMSASDTYDVFERETLRSMESEPGLREKQFECGDESGIASITW
jgi:sarcosine oxidase/L-pipecolate oxidase